MDKVTEFKKELKELLKKYSATLNVDCSDCSDLYGVYGEEMSVDIDGVLHKLCDGWGIIPDDLN